MRHYRAWMTDRIRWPHFVTALAAGIIGLTPTALAASVPSAPSLVPLSSARLMAVDMVTPTVGYTDGYQHGQFVLWRTNDAGGRWTRYAVPGSPLAKNPNTTTPTVSFFGPQIGWIAWIVGNQKSSTLTVLRTTTGGRRWRRSVTMLPRAMSMVEQLDFTSTKTGWIRAFSGGAMMQGDTDILRTTNQGASWTIMSAASGYVPNPHPTPNALPAMDEPMPMTFTNATDGWVAVGNLVVATASASLYHSTDAGARWIPLALPIPKDFEGNNTIGFTPVFSGPRGTVLMQYQGKSESDHVLTYGTTDGGATWTIKSVLALDPSQFALQSSFINADRGWLVDDALTRFDATSNGGKTWSSIPISGVLQLASEHGYRVENLQMTSNSTGWLLLQRINGGTSATKSLLLKTTDGGAIWERAMAANGTWPA